MVGMCVPGSHAGTALLAVLRSQSMGTTTQDTAETTGKRGGNEKAQLGEKTLTESEHQATDSIANDYRIRQIENEVLAFDFRMTRTF